MRARWAKHLPNPQEPTVAWTIVARWFPGMYYTVSTIEVRMATSDDPMSKLIRSMNSDVRDVWVSQVFRSDHYGVARSETALYKREYPDEVAAVEGHAEIANALANGEFGPLLGYTPEQVMRLSWLRAVEWLAWPAFISQPVLPLLYLFWPWYSVLFALAATTLIWRVVRYRYFNYTMATFGCLYVRLKWPIMLVLGAYYAWHHQYLLAVLSLVTPLIVMAMTAFSTGNIGTVQRKIITQLLFRWDIEALAATESNAASATA